MTLLAKSLMHYDVQIWFYNLKKKELNYWMIVLQILFILPILKWSFQHTFITCHTIINWHSSFEALCFLKLYSIFIVLHSTYFGERYENKLKSIFDQWLNLNPGLNARLEIEIFNWLYWKCNLRPIVYFWNPCQLDITINLPRFMGWVGTFIDFFLHVDYKLFKNPISSTRFGTL